MKAFWLMVIFIYKPPLVDSYCPERCLCLWYSDHTLKINCSGSEQTEVPYGLHHQVKVLDLSYNEIKTYNHSKYLKIIEEIDLSNNKITEAYFGGPFKYLKHIDLSNNSISNLKSIQIQNLKKLKTLNLSHNNKLIQFSDLISDSVEFVDLSHCFVSFVEENFTDDIPNIKFMDLSFNTFRSLNNIRSKSLEKLDVSHGQVENLTQIEIFNLPNLIQLNASFNPNLKIDFSYENSCWDVKELDLSNSNMTSLSDMFPFCSLEVLNASLNNIKIIEVRTFFNNCELIYINLSNNRISEIHSQSFFTTDKLKILDLSDNQIEDITFSLYLKQVTDLNLSKNQISNLEELVLKNVVNLNLSRNKIKEISINFNEKTPRLKKLNLSFNKIRIVNKINSKSLNQVDLSNCDIETIEVKAFISSNNLNRINLKNNKLTTLDLRVFKHLENLKVLELSQNPWSCQCQSPDFKELYEFFTIERSFINTHELQCLRSNDTWRNTCRDTWQKQKEWKKTVYSLSVSLAIAMIVIVVIFFCKYFNDKKEMRAMEQVVLQERRNCFGIPDYINNNSFSSLSLNIQSEPQEIPNRSSTPPPNYEAALLLPKLTEEQRKLAISTLSIAATPTANSPEENEETIEPGLENQEEERNQNFTINNY